MEPGAGRLLHAGGKSCRSHDAALTPCGDQSCSAGVFAGNDDQAGAAHAALSHDAMRPIRQAVISSHPSLAVGLAVTRSILCLALVVGAAQFGGAASLAQTPPSERELRIYAGLHDAAARGDATEIEQLI